MPLLFLGGAPPVMYATASFTIQLPSGASHLVIEGCQRDASHPAVTGNPAAFTGSPPLADRGHVTPKLHAYLQAHPRGPGE